MAGRFNQKKMLTNFETAIWRRSDETLCGHNHVRQMNGLGLLRKIWVEELRNTLVQRPPRLERKSSDHIPDVFKWMLEHKWQWRGGLYDPQVQQTNIADIQEKHQNIASECWNMNGNDEAGTTFSKFTKLQTSEKHMFVGKKELISYPRILQAYVGKQMPMMRRSLRSASPQSSRHPRKNIVQHWRAQGKSWHKTKIIHLFELWRAQMEFGKVWGFLTPDM